MSKRKLSEMAVRGHVHEMERQMKLATHKNQGRLQGLAKMAAFDEVNHDDDAQQNERDGNKLRFICVKLSSLSGVQEIINDLSDNLLNKIHALAATKNSEPDKNKKRALHKQQLIKSAYRFAQNCPSEARQCVERSVGCMYNPADASDADRVRTLRQRCGLFGAKRARDSGRLRRRSSSASAATWGARARTRRTRRYTERGRRWRQVNLLREHQRVARLFLVAAPKADCVK